MLFTVKAIPPESCLFSMFLVLDLFFLNKISQLVFFGHIKLGKIDTMTLKLTIKYSMLFILLKYFSTVRWWK